jgi:hypothetical protein
MSVKFFGQFLLLEEAVSVDQLREALQLMESEHKVLGELAVENNLITAEQAGDINRAQLTRDLPFGMLAVEKGLLTEKQVEDLLQQQSKRRLRLGEALVRLGHLDAVEIDSLLEKFNADQAPFFGSDLDLPDLLRDNTLAVFVLDLLPKIAMRVSRLHLKVANSDQEAAGGYHDSTASIVLRGSSGIRVSISADKAFASKLMTGMVRIMSGDFEAMPDDDSDQEDLLGEFLSILAGHALGAFEQKGEKLSVEPPTYGTPPDGATAFALVSPHGSAKVFLAGL